MHWVSLFIELLRTRPVAIFWAAALTQAALWTLVPALFYAAPPGELAEFLAVAREWGLGNPFGPPLAYWLGEIAFRAGGLPAVYLLSQVCVVVAFWAVFSLGRIIVGAPHAAMAILLMAGIAAFGVPTPEFGAAILAMPLWALILLHYWRAVGQGRRSYWFVIGIEAGLLLLTTYSGFVLIGLLVLFTLATRRGRDQFTSFEPLAAGAVVVLVFFPHLVWIEQTNALSAVRFAGASGVADNAWSWVRVLGLLLAGHAGLALLALLGRGFTLSPRGIGAEILRAPVDPDARPFIYFFALAPAVAIGIITLVTGRPDSFIAPALVVLSGLAVVVAAPDRIRIVHQRATQYMWAALLLVPPLLVALAVPLLPWTLAVDLRVSLPAAEMGRFFAENFERRTGRPLAIVTGDSHIAALVALTAPSRPSLYVLTTPELSPRVTRQDIEAKGAVVVWPATTTRGIPPTSIQERLHGLVPELPRAFERTVQGRLPLTRIGWSVIRPSGAAVAPSR
jgi:4-amino-4-deoxy-L-arabinose transferase-like glycosyltransferase